MTYFKICFGMFLFTYKTFVFAQIDMKTNPAVFEPGNNSTTSVEYSSSLSVLGEEIYFARSDRKWGEKNIKSSIYHTVKSNNKWSTPKIASISGQFDDSDPHLTKDGNTLYFISKRPFKGIQISADIWKTEKDETGEWGEPIRLPFPLNSQSDEYSPCTDNQGNLYFASNRAGGYGQGDLYVAQTKNGEFSSPINMGSTINSSLGEWNLEINDNGDLIIFEASQRKQNVSSYGDLYISFKLGYSWTIPQNIKELNTSGSDLYPDLTNDGDFLYYTSSDSLKGLSTNIYFVKFNNIYSKYKLQAKIPE